MDTSLKEKIIEYRKENKSYNEISKLLGCSKAVISYHCKNNELTDIGLRRKSLNDDEIVEMNEYYKNHTIKETSIKFNVGITTVKSHTENKMIILSDIERRKKNYERIKNIRIKTKEYFVKYKGGKCEKCGYDKCIHAFDFHHIDPKEKEFNFSKYNNYPIDKIIKEVDKCILVCANCHREIHYNERIIK